MNRSLQTYGWALLSIIGAWLARWLLDSQLGNHALFVTFYVAVVAATWLGGVAPGLLATGFGFVLGLYSFASPRHSLWAAAGGDIAGVVLYFLVCFVIIAMGEAMRRAQARFEERFEQQRSPWLPVTGIEALWQKQNSRDLVVVGFALTLGLLVVDGFLGYLNIKRVAENEGAVAHSHQVIGELEGLLSTLKDAETGQRGYLLTDDPTYLAPYTDALERLHTEVARVKELTADNAEQQSRLKEMEGKVAEKVDELEQTIELVRKGDRDAAMKIVRSARGINLMDDLRKQATVMRGTEEALLRTREAESRTSSQAATASDLVTTIVGLMLVGVVFRMSGRNLKARERAAIAFAEQGERLRTTLASIGDAVIATDTGGHVTNMNAEAERLTEWSNAEAEGHTLDEVFHIVNEQSRLPVESPALRALREGKIVGLANHTVLIGKKGAEWPIDDSAAPIRCADGEIVGCVLVFRDVAERRQREQLLHQRDALLQSVTDNAEVGLVIIGTEHKYIYANKSFARVLGLPAKNIVGSKVADVLPTVYESEIRLRLDQALAGETVQYELTLPPLAGKEESRHFAITYTPLREEDAVESVVVSVIDVSNRKRVEDVLRDADRRKDEFLAILAHELRNPLAPIRNALSLLHAAGEDREVFHTATDMIRRQLTQLVRLIDDLLDVSRISRGKLELRKERVELNSILDQAVEIARPATEMAHLQLTKALPVESVFLQADPVRLTQVISNLLNNACKFTGEGGRIEVSAERRGADVVVSVKDTGIGIPPDKLESIFEMFSQVDRPVGRHEGGLGIGLTLVRRLVEMHEGTIEARSEGLGKGSEFVVRLPIAVEAKSVKPPVEAPAAVDGVPGKRKMLVVDDNHDSAKSLAMLLRLAGNDVQMAFDGEEAVECAARIRPEVILLDIGLPKLNGYDACRRIREQPWGKDLVIIALTGWGQAEDRRKSSEAGFDRHLVKPVEHGTLTVMLKELLEKKG